MFIRAIVPRLSREQGSETRAAVPKNLGADATILEDTIIDIHSKTSKPKGKQARLQWIQVSHPPKELPAIYLK